MKQFQQLGKAVLHVRVCDMGEHREDTPTAKRIILLPVLLNAGDPKGPVFDVN